MKIGILGGTFDPVHTAHLAIAEQAVRQLGLDRVLFIPAWIAPHKGQNRAATERTKHRLAMLRLAVKGNAAFAVSDIEVARGGTSYTIDTLRALRAAKGPDAEFSLLIGADNFAQFDTWREAGEIPRLCSIAVYARPGCPLGSLPRHIRALDGPLLDISATWLRRQTARGGSIRYLVPEPVRAYIERHKLYR
ncbi:nicotinate (nicotinamide) nucleotide adenylyltransferase [bacterium]|nr:nicotinate (nicotinamide) nucleotide adenylyltransferase [bacterium]